jgi:rfaE bifunctional protein nucleotidyltransferase chain/domain/rfaE bifunctional protein kinase chain/domain
MGTLSWLDQHRTAVSRGLDSLGKQAATVDRWGAELARLLVAGGRLLAAGNGGSAAEAQHLTAELVGRYVDERQPLSALSLCVESSSVTAIGNDYGHDEVFARQVAAHGRAGDVLLLLSTSGRSSNLLSAAERARRCGVRVWALTGAGPNPLADAADEAVVIDAPDTSAVQEVHLVTVHALCAAVDALLVPKPVERQGGRRPRIAVVGDLLLDRDLTGRTDRISPDAPVPVVDVEDVAGSPGGAGLVALLAAEEADVTLVAPVADDEAGRRLRSELTAAGVELHVLPHAGPTRRKTRIRAAGQTLLRFDDGGPGTPDDVDKATLREVLFAADVVLVADYGAGTTAHPTVRSALTAVTNRRPVVWDPHPKGAAPVPGCALVTPNFAEARHFAEIHGLSAAGPVETLADALREHWNAQAVCVTTGAGGAWLVTPEPEPVFVPAARLNNSSATDTCGAGDRFATSAAQALATGAGPSDAVAVAVRSATAWVQAGGTAAHHARRTSGGAEELAPLPAEAHGLEDAVALAARVRSTGGTLVATGGCFDVLHAGHVTCLDAARRLGDALVVLLNSDSSVSRLKGHGRPVQTADDRARALAGLSSVDAVVVFDEDDPQAALASLRPDVWAKGGDYGGVELPESPLVRSWGGRVVLLPYLAGRSSSEILARGTALAT